MRKPMSGAEIPAARGHWGRGGLRSKPSALGNFSIKISYFYAHLGQNRYFEVITPQLKT